jgi:hypothetical protein
MWSEEIMNEYPCGLLNYPEEWIRQLDSLGPEELYAVDSKIMIPEVAESGFADFMAHVLNLSRLPTIPEIPEILLEDWAFNGVKKKKRHEIQKIASTLKKILESHPFDYAIDIGGGVGHLSRVLAHYHGIACLSIDQNAHFQEIGKERLKKYRKLPGSRDVNFVNMVFGNNDSNHLNPLQDIFKPNSFSLGLHTCGPLANILLKESIKFKTTGLLSFGCCYHSLNPATDFPLSSFYKDNQFFKINLYALSLATRSHVAMSRPDFKTKERVKYFRYGLHLFLLKHFNNKHFTEVGECNVSVYWGEFSSYVKMKMNELNIPCVFSDDYINQYFNEATTQKELRKMFLCNIIRWQLGRLLEIYLLLDRCLFLEENGYKVKVEQYFEEALSPRNIGILALKI